MIRIGINGADLEGRGTGVKRYLSSILPYLDDKDKEYYIYSRAPLPKGAIPAGKQFIERPTGNSIEKSYSLWEQTVLPRFLKRDSINVFFSAGYSIPICMSIPSIVVIHDISFSVHPEWYSFREGWRRRVLSRLSAKKAKKVLTVSEFSRKELIDRYNLNEKKVIIAANAVTKHKFEYPKSKKDILKKRYNLGGPIILYVGLLLERRHIRQLIEAFGLVKKQHSNASLVLVGNNQLKPPVEISDLASSISAEESVVHIPYVEEEDLALFYGISDVFVYLSDYEGFGLPPLEAVNAGVPVITSRSSSLAEIYNGSAVLIDKHTPEEISEQINLLLTDKTLQIKLLNAGKKLLKKFSWEQTAKIINWEIDKLSSKN